MNGENIVEAVHVDGAAQVAERVGEAVSTGDAILSSQVAGVGEAVAEHAEVSEERHEEILGEQEVCQDGQQLLMSQMTALQSNLLSFQTATQAAQAAMLAELQTLNGRLSTGLRPLTPETPEGPPPIVEPVSEEEGHPEAAPKKRRVKVI